MARRALVTLGSSHQPEVSQMPGANALTRDVVDILTTDHQEMLELIGQIKLSRDAGQRRDLADTVTAEVMRHAVAEEMYVYPAMQKHLPNGDEEAEHDKQEHQEIVEVLKQIEGIDAADPA